jgi:hypothetical protein
MAIRCKMRLDNVFAQSWGGAKAIFTCSYDPDVVAEDRGFQKATPAGHAEFQIDNPKAAEQLVIGNSYYFDITPVPPAEYMPCQCKVRRQIIADRELASAEKLRHVNRSFREDFDAVRRAITRRLWPASRSRRASPASTDSRT